MNIDSSLSGIVLVFTVLLFFALLGRLLARRLGLAVSTGELCLGLLVGNLGYLFNIDQVTILREGAKLFETLQYALYGETLKSAVTFTFGVAQEEKILTIITGENGIDYLKLSQAADAFFQFGILFLIFELGLRHQITQLKATPLYIYGLLSFDLILAMLAASVLVFIILPNAGLLEILFVAIALASSNALLSVGIMRQHSALNREAHSLLALTKVDNLILLILLMLLTSVMVDPLAEIPDILVKFVVAVIFMVVTWVAGHYGLSWLVKYLRWFDLLEVKFFVALILAMLFSVTAYLIGLSPLIGIFMAGIVLHDVYFHSWQAQPLHEFRVMCAPLEIIVAPLLFFLIGFQVKMEVMLDPRALVLSILLLLAAIAIKVLGTYAIPRGHHRLIMAASLWPRGEVALVVVALGKALNVLDDTLFFALVMMIVVSNLVTPLMLHRLTRLAI